MAGEGKRRRSRSRAAEPAACGHPEGEENGRAGGLRRRKARRGGWTCGGGIVARPMARIQDTGGKGRTELRRIGTWANRNLGESKPGRIEAWADRNADRSDESFAPPPASCVACSSEALRAWACRIHRHPTRCRATDLHRDALRGPKACSYIAKGGSPGFTADPYREDPRARTWLCLPCGMLKRGLASLGMSNPPIPHPTPCHWPAMLWEQVSARVLGVPH